MIVVKFGGHAMTDSGGFFAKAIQETLNMGQSCVIVHGGGPQIDAALKRAGIESVFVGGYRTTSPEALEIVEQVLTGSVSPTLVGQLRSAGINAVGISGRDGGVLGAKRMTVFESGMEKSLGEVGEVESVDTALLTLLLEGGYVPVVAPIATLTADHVEHSTVGLNVNADLAAGAIAGALGAQSLIILTDVPGIYRNWPDENSLIATIRVEELRSIQSHFSEGMAPKVLACINAIDAGTKSVRIIDGTNAESFSLALRGIGGTVVTQ